MTLIIASIVWGAICAALFGDKGVPTMLTITALGVIPLVYIINHMGV